MTPSTPHFPAHFPPGCPPADATDADQTVCRLVVNDPPTEEDFLSHAELGKGAGGNACLRCGLSVLPNQDAARELYYRIRALYGEAVQLGNRIARGTLSPTHGKLKPTGRPPHMTWWPYEGINRLDGFIVLEEITDVAS